MMQLYCCHCLAIFPGQTCSNVSQSIQMAYKITVYLSFQRHFNIFEGFGRSFAEPVYKLRLNVGFGKDLFYERAATVNQRREMDVTVTTRPLARELLYIADEVFFCGTAAEITPIRSVDRIPVGKGKPGPITLKLQERYLSIAEGRAEDTYGWLTLCNQPVAAGR